MRVLITGGTGSLGRALTAELLRKESTERVVIYSRDEVKQAEMARVVPDERVRFFLGDVRDLERLREALSRIDTVVHAAALKRVDSVSYNPQEVLKTNVLGTQNVLHASTAAGVARVLLISSDKAVNPVNLYGASKLMAEFLTVRQNVLSFALGTACSVLRYGNVWGSRGSVMEVFAEQARAGVPLTVTDPAMTRFYLSLEMAAAFVLEALAHMEAVPNAGGEIFVPVLRAWSLEQVASAYAPKERWTIVGRRPGGEKLHEQLLSEAEHSRVINAPRRSPSARLFVVPPELHEWCREHWLDAVPPAHLSRPYISSLAEQIEPFVPLRPW